MLATLAGVRFAADAVHGDRERLVRFLADRSIRHRARREPLQNRVNGLDFVDWNRLRRGLQFEQAAERTETPALVVESLVYSLIDGVLPLRVAC